MYNVWGKNVKLGSILFKNDVYYGHRNVLQQIKPYNAHGNP